MTYNVFGGTLNLALFIYPAAWNSLPPDVRAAASPAMFKKLLETHFFNISFSTC